MNFKIRKATINDMQSVFYLIQELATFEKLPNEVEITIADLKEDGFGKRPKFNCFVAEIEGEIIGMALVFNRYSTWKGKIIHLEDLVVQPNKRGLGVGTALLDEVVKYGHKLGVKRISWDVLDWNTNAIALYEKKGAKVLHDWKAVHLSEEGIKNYIANL